MGNRYHASFSFALIALVMSAFVFPLFTHATSRAEIRAEIADRATARMCARQAELSARLPRPIIAPSICAGTPAEPALTLAANPTTIDEGEDATLSWSTTNATSCTASGGWSGAKNVSGEEKVSPENTTTYTLSCTGAGGSVAKSVTITVTPAPEMPTVDITANPVSVTAGQTSELSWVSTNATSCTASNAWSGDKATTGSQSVTPVITSTYAISCTGAGGTANDSVTVTVTAPEAATLTLVKTVVNDDAGVADADDFQAKIDGNNVAWNTAIIVTPGAHTASETNLAGYVAGAWGGDCAANGSVTLAAGEDKTCTITNDDAEPEPEPTITDIVVADDRFDTLEAAVGAAGLADDLDSDGPFTVFAPTDSAFDALPDGVLASLLADPTGALRDVLLYHVVSGEFNSAAVVAADMFTTLLGKDVDITVEGQNVRVNDSLITVVDVQASNGVIHIIDAVLTPPVEPTEDHLLISEVYYDVASTTTSAPNDASYEWLEIYNPTGSAVNLQGWFVGDASSTDEIIANVSVPAGGFVVVVASNTPAGIPGGVSVIKLSSSIGQNGFANSGDGARLLNVASEVVDSVGYGTNVTVSPNVSISAPTDGHSLRRVQLTNDTDTAADWADSGAPTPGA